MTAPAAGRPARLDARSLRDLVLDPGSWKTWDSPVPPRTVDDDYAAELAEAAQKTRQDESIITGEGGCAGGASPSLPGSSASSRGRSASRPRSG